MECRICGNAEKNQTYPVREMLFGTRETFNYVECGFCGCLQLIDAPKDTAKYYSGTYHSPNQSTPKVSTLKNRVRSAASRLAFKTQLTLNKRLLKSTAHPTAIFYSLPSKTRLTLNSRILEVGCGRGELLWWLHSMGFSNLLGIDPYVPERQKCAVEIQRKPISELSEQQLFDLIIFDHSFEHIKHEAETLDEVRRLLSKTGTCLIRLPMKSEFIWRKYGVNWVQIDAPRHFFVHTQRSLILLVNQAGFKVENTVFDSTEFQFWASEQYLADIPLRATNSYWVNPDKSPFSQSQIQQYKATAAKLNKRQQGDQATFYLTKT